MYGCDPGGSKKAKFLKSSNLSKTGVRSKRSSRRFQRHSFHLKRTPYEKVIAFCSIRSTSKISKKRCHVAPLIGWHVASIQYGQGDMVGVWTNHKVTHGSTDLSWLPFDWAYGRWRGNIGSDWAWGGPIPSCHVETQDWSICLIKKFMASTRFNPVTSLV